LFYYNKVAITNFFFFLVAGYFSRPPPRPGGWGGGGGSAAARLLGLWVRIPPGPWMSVCCEGCVLSGRGLCVGLVTRPEESYRVLCV